MKEVTGSVETLLEDVSGQFREQVVANRSLVQKTFSKMPAFLQPANIKSQNKQTDDFKQIKAKIHALNTSIDDIEETFEVIPSQEEMAKRVYSLANPGEPLTENKLEEIEKRFQEMEKNFLDSMQTITGQMDKLTQTLSAISEKLEEQGVVINNIDVKMDRIETNMEKMKGLLEKISSKITQNKLLLAFIAGAVIIALLVMIL